MAQPVEQLTRNEQVVRSNRISSSKVKSPKSGFAPSFSGIFVCLRKCLSRGMWALITPISRKVLQKGGSRGGAKRGEAKLLVNKKWDDENDVLPAGDLAVG